MGVPGFFLWFIKKHKGKKFVFKKNPEYEEHKMDDVDMLLIDANCLLHPQCFKVLAQYQELTDKNKLEKKMIEKCIEYLQYLIEFTGPKKEIYIAIDGVAPCAKIKQQRQRRFKSVKTRNVFNGIKKKYNKKIENQWNNSAITPGTDFMQLITKAVLKFVKEYNFKGKIIFSSANTPSEGEHKLLQYIRNSEKEYKYAIYGLDADLIFLALAANKPNIYLFREASEIDHINKEHELLNYVSIDILKQCILQEINDLLFDEFIERDLDDESVIRDFIFVCYFLGNDFLPHNPLIDIKAYRNKTVNGLDLLLQAYAHSYDNLEEYLVLIDDNGDIKYNKPFLQMFLEYITAFENEYFVTLYGTKKYRHRCLDKDPYVQEMHRINNLMFKIDNPIKLGKDCPDDWKFRYYKKYYFTEINQREIVRNACNKYFEGLVWIANYYFKKCPSWDWYYPYDHSPFISDMLEFIKRYDFDNVKFDLGKPLKPIEQLLCVLPPQSGYLLPRNCIWLMKNIKSPIIDLYPYDFEVDFLYKHKYWQGIPILPDLNIPGVKEAVKRIRFDTETQKKNEIKDIHIIEKS